MSCERPLLLIDNDKSSNAVVREVMAYVVSARASVLSKDAM